MLSFTVVVVVAVVVVDAVGKVNGGKEEFVNDGAMSDGVCGRVGDEGYLGEREKREDERTKRKKPNAQIRECTQPFLLPRKCLLSNTQTQFSSKRSISTSLSLSLSLSDSQPQQSVMSSKQL